MTLSSNQYLETASRIGARICRDAIWSGGRCNWLGDSMEKLDGSWKVAHRALGPDFYGGTSGIALFLDRLHVLTGEKLFRETAEGAVFQAYSRVHYMASNIRPSFYLGLTGIAYSLASMGLEDKARET
jgi:lantibiotic biosynthesis protein